MSKKEMVIFRWISLADMQSKSYLNDEKLCSYCVKRAEIYLKQKKKTKQLL